ncbi:hypothetical protein [Planomonospora algeriensis]
MTYESVLVQRLQDKGFAVEAGPVPGEYIVTASGDRPLPLRPRLHLPDAVLAEYVEELVREFGSTEEVVDLIMINIEEMLDSLDPEGRNHTLALGVQRETNGRAAWFTQTEPISITTRPVDPALEWRAYPPDDR